MAPGSILVIDDNPGLTDMWSLVLQEKGYEVEVAGSGAEALRKLRGRPFNLALVDIHLPDSRGTDLLADISRIRPDTDCVMITAHSSLESAIEALNRGAYAYLIKPVEPVDLLAVVARALERQRLQEENRRMMLEVQTAHRILHAIVDSIDSGVLLVGTGGAIHYANRRGVELLNLSEPPAGGEDTTLVARLVAAAEGSAAPTAPQAWGPPPIGGPPGEQEWEVGSARQRRVLRRYCVPVYWEDGGTLGQVEVYSDITRDKAILERQRQIAEVLQSSILPAIPETLGGHEIATLYHAAIQDTRVGGDFYDAFPVGPNRIAVVIGDVSGKGLTAAIQTAMARFALRSYAFEDPEPATVMARLNRLLYAQGLLESFTTLFYAVLDAGRGVLCYTNAGHEPALLASPEAKAAQPLTVGGPAVGCIEGARYETGADAWLPGSLLLLYTDGASEARRSGVFLGAEGVAALLGAHAAAGDARLVLQRIYAGLQQFTPELHDDLALVTVRRPPLSG